jgi:hypothetical protein
MKTQLTTFVLFMVLPMSHSFAKNVKKKANKKTVGYYLSQVQQQSRGGKISSQQKNAMQLPTAKKDLGFSPKTESDMNNIKPPRANEILQLFFWLMNLKNPF